MVRKYLFTLLMTFSACFAPEAHAALPGNTSWEVRSDTTGGNGDTLAGGAFCGNGLTPAPTAPSLTVNAGTGCTGTFFVRITYNNLRGDGPSSTETSTGAISNKAITVTSPAASTYATSYTTYIGTTTGGPYFFQATTAIGTNFTRSSTPASTVAAGPETSTAPGVDYSQQVAAQVTSANFTTAVLATTTITFVGYTPTANDVGNVVFVPALVGVATGYYQIVSFSATTWTIDRTVGAGNVGSDAICMGGALASMGQAGNAIFNLGGTVAAAHTVWIRQGSYTVGSASTNVATGCLLLSGTNGVGSSGWLVIGYATAGGRGDFTARPTLTLNQNSATVIASSAQYATIDNLILDCGSGSTGTTGISFTAAGDRAIRCKVSNSATDSFKSTSSDDYFGFDEASAFSAGDGFNCTAGALCEYCEAHGGSATGFASALGYFSFCLSYANTGSTSDGFAASSHPAIYIGCVAYGNGRHGFNQSGASNFIAGAWTNCVAEGNGVSVGTGAGWNIANNNLYAQWFSCAGYNNAGGLVTGATTYLPINLTNSSSLAQTGILAYGATAFTSATNFLLNSNSPGGAQLRALGTFGATPSGTSTGAADIGAIQHADPVRPVTTRSFRGN